LIDEPVRRWVKWVNDDGEPRLIAAFEGERKIECIDPKGVLQLCAESNYTKAWTGRYDVLIGESEYRAIRDRWTKVKAIELPLPPAGDSWTKVKAIELPLPPAGDSWWNNAELTAEQVEVDKGWRLMLLSEHVELVRYRKSKYTGIKPTTFGSWSLWQTIDRWSSQDNCDGTDTNTTYRTRQPIPVRAACIPEPPAGESWHNPDNVTAEQLGVREGWRLLLSSEVGKPETGNPLYGRCDSWGSCSHEWTSGRNWGMGRKTTYRTRFPLPGCGTVPLSELQPIVRRIGDGPSGTILYSDYDALHKLAQL
jgi:hypothetical protein